MGTEGWQGVFAFFCLALAFHKIADLVKDLVTIWRRRKPGYDKLRTKVMLARLRLSTISLKRGDVLLVRPRGVELTMHEGARVYAYLASNIEQTGARVVVLLDPKLDVFKIATDLARAAQEND